jgi:hypothetical protein
VIKYLYGGTFEGYFASQAQRRGFGRYTWPDGDYFEGEWFGGRNGTGLLFTKDGKTYLQSWKESVDIDYSPRPPPKFPEDPGMSVAVDPKLLTPTPKPKSLLKRLYDRFVDS